MAPTPRKSAPSTFAPTWHDTDVEFLDPAALPVTKAPRAWDRKQKTVKTRDGREKKVWRRYTTRSKTAANAPTDEEEQEEEEDSRYRAVKKLQRVRPDDMTMTVAASKTKKRAFKATRWDRRKSVLPRKRAASASLVEEEVNESEEDGQDADISTDIVMEPEVLAPETSATVLESMGQADRRRSAFTFSAEDINSRTTEEGIGHRAEQDAKPSSPQPVVETTKDGIESPAAVLMDHATVPDEEEVLSTNVDSAEAQHNDEQASLQITMSEEEDLDIAKDYWEGEEPIIVDEKQPDTQLVIEPMGDQQEEQPIDKSEILPNLDAPNETEDADMSEFTLDLDNFSPRRSDTNNDTATKGLTSKSEEECTSAEASLQFKIRQEMDLDCSALNPASPVGCTQDRESVYSGEEPLVLGECIATPDQTESANVEAHESCGALPDQSLEVALDDIANGLTLAPTIPTSPTPSKHRLRSPSPPPPTANSPDDVTTTMYLDDDTAMLKDFLSRAAASKAEKSATIARRSSNQNRRDSDAIRQALASPRKVLEDKDPNSPSKHDNDVTLDLSQTLTLNMDQQLPVSPTPNAAEETDEKSLKTSRRSTRTRKSRLPAPSISAAPLIAPTLQGPTSISVRRTDGGDPIVLKRTEAQELGLATRNNTRKNKQGAMSVGLRLLKLAAEAASQSAQDGPNSTAVPNPGKKYVRWDETLAYFQENPEILAEAESLATPDELSASIPVPTIKRKVKESRDKNATPRLRRVRGLGTTNGTPGKGLLPPATLLPDEIQDESQAGADKPARLPKSSKIKKLSIAPTSSEPTSTMSPSKAAPLEVAPVGVEPTKERKSRLAQPKKVKMPQPLLVASTIPLNGKENQQAKGIGGASPKKGLKLPEPVIPAKIESGLPRRRGVKRT